MGAWDWLFGNAEAAQIQPGQFGKPQPFPTDQDLAQAKAADEFRYAAGSTPNQYTIESREVDPSQLPLTDSGAPDYLTGIRGMAEGGQLGQLTDPRILDTIARNKLASHASAIGSLGYNSSLDNVVKATDFNLGTSKSMDLGTSLVNDYPHEPFTLLGKKQSTGTPMHEGIHRGLQRVLDEIYNMPNSPETSALRDYLSNATGAKDAAGNPVSTNERSVRWLMDNLYSDQPEERGNMMKEYASFLDDPARQSDRDEAAQMMGLAETIAQRLVKQRKPGGPW